MNERIGYVLKKAQAALRARTDEALETSGLTMPQYAALSALERSPGLSNAELARRSFVTPQTMIRIVGTLEAMGWVTRSPHPTHGKVLQTMLTAKGKELVADCHRQVLAVETRMLRSLTAGERKQLLDMLERCFRALDSQRQEGRETTLDARIESRR